MKKKERTGQEALPPHPTAISHGLPDPAPLPDPSTSTKSLFKLAALEFGWRFLKEAKTGTWLRLAGTFVTIAGMMGGAYYFNNWIGEISKHIAENDLNGCWNSMKAFVPYIISMVALRNLETRMSQSLGVTWSLWARKRASAMITNPEVSDQGPHHPKEEETANETDFHTFTLVSRYTLVAGLLSLGRTAVYASILLNLSMPLTFGKFQIPGGMGTASALFCLLASYITYRTSRGLVPIRLHQDQLFARLRDMTTRFRSNKYNICTRKGTDIERQMLDKLNDEIACNGYDIVRKNTRIFSLGESIGHLSLITPYFLFLMSYTLSPSGSLADIFKVLQAFYGMKSAVDFFAGNITMFANLLTAAQRIGRFVLKYGSLLEPSDIHCEFRPESGKIPENKTVLHASNLILYRPTIPANPNGSSPSSALNGTKPEPPALTETSPEPAPLVMVRDLAITKGARVLLTGRSGHGKSTLLRALFGLRHGLKGSGEISIMGIAPDEIMLLPQKPYFPDAPLRDILSYPNIAKQYAYDEMVQALRDVSGRQKTNEPSLADRLIPILEDNNPASTVLKTLSGGELQRLMMACVLLQKPKLLALDEATSALDTAGRDSLLKKLFERLPETTIIRIEHNPDYTQCTHHLHLAERTLHIVDDADAPSGKRRHRSPGAHL